VTYGNGTFVAVGHPSTILTSTDGVNWTRRTSGTSVILSGVIYGNNIFIAVGTTASSLPPPEVEIPMLLPRSDSCGAGALLPNA